MKKQKPIVFFRVYCLCPGKYEKAVRSISKDLYYYGVCKSFDVHGVKTLDEAIQRVRPHVDGIVTQENMKKIMNRWKAEATKRKLTYAKDLTIEKFWQFAGDKMSSPDGVIALSN